MQKSTATSSSNHARAWRTHPGSVGRIIAFVLVGAVGGFYVQGELERGYKEKQLRAYEDYLERTSKTKTKKNK